VWKKEGAKKKMKGEAKNQGVGREKDEKKPKTKKKRQSQSRRAIKRMHRGKTNREKRKGPLEKWCKKGGESKNQPTFASPPKKSKEKRK